jgi:hypothetical protein
MYVTLLNKNNNMAVEAALVENPDLVSDLYPNYFTTIGHFIFSLRIALKAAYASLPVSIPPLPATQPPEIQYDNETGLISFVLGFGAMGYAPNYEIFVNENLYNVISSFWFIIVKNPPTSNSYAKFIANPLDLSLVKVGGIPPLINYNCIIYPQQYPSLYLLDDVVRFLISTSLIPIHKESVTSVNPSKDDNRPLLVSIETDSEQRFNDNAFVYEIGDRKLIDIKSDIPIRTIQYKIEIEMNDGTILPYYVRRGNSFGITFGFRNKKLYAEQARRVRY